MKITRRSPITGVETTLDIPVTQEQLDEWQGGALIQNVMPHLSAADREFILTGMSQEEWDYVMKEEE